jgi:UDP-glucose 4-epimerase
MRILITGGAGFIGSHVADQILTAGHEVTIVDDLSTGRRENLPKEATFYECDIRDPQIDEIIAAVRPDVISHHAAQMSVRVSIREPHRDASINIDGTINVLESARRWAVRKVIYASTGGALYGEPSYLPCDEEHRVAPLSHYGITKHTVEHYLELYAHLYGLDYTVLRYPNVYGPRQDPDGEAGVVAIFAGAMLQGLPITIYGDGHQQRDFVYVADVARANVLALTRGSRAIVNLGSAVGTSVLDVFSEISSITGYRYDPRFEAQRDGEVYQIYLTGDKAARELGWRPGTSLADGLRYTVNEINESHKSCHGMIATT